jgi:lipoprotein-releasing system ATP-binding protein
MSNPDMNSLVMNNVLHCKAIVKTFKQGANDVPVLKSIDFHVAKGETIAIVGASGSGKSTLLHILGGLDAPTSGEVVLLNQRMDKLSAVQQGNLRNRALGFIYQFHHLLPEFSALENVAMPLAIRGEETKIAKERAAQMLSDVGLSHRLTHKPGELSGGERQRVAVARALVTHPACVLADEPTGNLDRGTADSVFELIMRLNQKFETALVMVTHDPQLAAKMSRKLVLVDGVLDHN